MKLKNIPRFFGIILLSLVVVICSCQTNDQGGNQARPNIIYIMSDDHGYQAISSYNGKLNQTPHIDRIAEGGILFSNSFVTNSICAPSRATFLTGKHSHLNGQIDNRAGFDGSQLTFPKLLQNSGYQTAMVGKWHLKTAPTGFDYWNILPGQGDYYNPAFIDNGKDTTYEGYVTNLITDLGIEWMEQRDETKPFCLLVHHKAPHRNWMPDSSHFGLYDNVEFPIPDNFFSMTRLAEVASSGMFNLATIPTSLKSAAIASVWAFENRLVVRVVSNPLGYPASFKSCLAFFG